MSETEWIFPACILALVALDAAVCWYWRREERRRDQRRTGRRR